MVAIDTPNIAEDHFSASKHKALIGVGSFLRSFGATPLTGEALCSAYPLRRLSRGWRMPIQFTHEKRRLDVLLDEAFPFSAPRIALVDRPVFLTWPHLESDGLICILDVSSPTDVLKPVELLKVLLGDAVELVDALERGKFIHHFRDEFLTYWEQAEEMGSPVYSLLKPDLQKSRLVECWIGRKFTCVAECAVDIAHWLTNRFGARPQFASTDVGLFLWIGSPLLPNEYPKNAQQVISLIKKFGAESLLTKVSAIAPSRLPVVLGFASEHGNCFASVTLYHSVEQSDYMRKRPAGISGFRPGRAPLPLMAGRFIESLGKVVPSLVERIDHDWVHGRDTDKFQDTLKATHMVLLGCGSIGSLVVHQLVMAGIGHISLVDPERLASANVGRHYLGAKFLGKPKALSLAAELQSNFPHLHIQGYAMGWQEFIRDNRHAFEGASLVISMTGNWNSEIHLNSLHLQARSRQSVLYGWTEGHACAGHAVLIGASGGCLGCHFDSSGNPERQLTNWPINPNRQVPACGATFQPYGPVELGGTVGLIAGLALDSILERIPLSTHHIWKGSSHLLEAAGGTWNNDMMMSLNAVGRDNLQIRCDWTANSNCAMCGSDG